MVYAIAIIHCKIEKITSAQPEVLNLVTKQCATCSLSGSMLCSQIADYTVLFGVKALLNVAYVHTRIIIYVHCTCAVYIG